MPLGHSQSRLRGRGTELDAECDDPDWTYAERSEDQHQAGTERAFRLSGIHLRADSSSEGWSCVSGGESVEEERFPVAAESGRPAGEPERGPVDRRARSPESYLARVVELLWLRDPVDGVSSGRSLRLRASQEFPEAPPQGGVAGRLQFLGCDCVREVGGATAPRCTSGAASVSSLVKSVGKPDARNGHVRFDERGRETDRLPVGSDLAPFL